MDKKTKKDKFYIDTSALVLLFRHYPTPLRIKIWDNLEQMFSSGTIVSHRIVYDEITTSSKKQDTLSKSITPFRDSFETIKYDQSLIVRDIINKFPKLIDPLQEKEQADPWLISLAVLNKEDKVYLISEESETNQNRIPTVCKHFNIEHLNLERFFEKIGLLFEVTSK